MNFQRSKLFGRLGRWFGRNQLNPADIPRRFGAIPYRQADGEIVFLMITSRRAGRWIFPKGHPVDGLTPAESAAEEAYEEAGVRGSIGVTPIGRYRTSRTRPNDQAPVLIEMFPLEVTREFDNWPEKAERQRQWATLDEARDLLSEPGLVSLAEKIADEVQG